MEASRQYKSRWGRARFGGGPALLIGLSVGCGVLLSAGLGALFGLLVAQERPVLVGLLFGVMTLPATCGVFWAFFVDRKTLQGATEDPEASIESHWYDRAASAAFTDLLLVCGIGATIFSLTRLTANVGLVLAGVIVVAMADFAVRYWSIKKAEG